MQSYHRKQAEHFCDLSNLMASSSFVSFGVILVWLMSCFSYGNGCYTSIISFGDSLADTGNLKQLGFISNRVLPVFLPPYGENFLNQSTGRCSNGRLIIDFLAERLGMPLIPPFLQDNGNNNMVTFKQGVNFAVAGATALGPSVLEPRGIVNPMTNASLAVQLAWLKQLLPSICGNDSNCRDFIGRSLILVGEIGGNDYNYPILWGQPIEEVEVLVPLVIDTIISTINELIEMGAKKLVVPGNFPVGCSASYLTVCGSENEEYDPKTGCLVRLNQFAEYHNKLLQTKLKQVRDLHPDVNIYYADYYNAAMEIYRFPYKYGFTNGALKACCGAEGRYNVDPTVQCGEVSATVCDEPDTYVSWEGIHLTEAAYRIISKNLFSTPQFNSLCSTSTSGVGLSVSM
ncbi:putative sinapine esterase [Helianthus annuus]|nr:putative sinapine esterase [Helianthus annuus]